MTATNPVPGHLEPTANEALQTARDLLPKIVELVELHDYLSWSSELHDFELEDAPELANTVGGLTVLLAAMRVRLGGNGRDLPGIEAFNYYAGDNAKLIPELDRLVREEQARTAYPFTP